MASGLILTLCTRIIFHVFTFLPRSYFQNKRKLVSRFRGEAMETVDNILSALGEISKQQLSQIILNIPGAKDLIIDPILMKPLDRVIGLSDLRNLGINDIRKLDSNALGSPSPDGRTSRVFLLKSDVMTAKAACDKIAAEQQANTSSSYHFIMVPSRLTSVEVMVEEEGLGGLISMWALPWAPLRFDSNLLSLELPEIFSQLFVYQDQTMLCAVAKSLCLLEMLLGKPKVTLKLGQFAKKVEGLNEVYQNESGEGSDLGLLDCAILVDRDIDLASVLLTPATYTALLDEVVGLSCGVLELSGVGPRLLSYDDEVYSQIKNRHFSDVFTFLSLKAKQLNAERERCQQMQMKEMREFISNQLKGVTALKRSVATHIGCCEAIITALGSRFEGLLRVEQSMLKGINRRESTSYIKDCLATGLATRASTLRLMCLHSLTQDGLASDEGASLKEQYLHAYGYQLLPAFHHLERLGLYSSGGSGASGASSGGVDAGRLASRVAQAVNLPKKSSFQATCERFKCFPNDSENLQLKQPTDMSYVFSGAYIPAVCQLVNMIINKKIALTDVGKIYPGASMSGQVGPQTPLKTILVYFIGGVTYAEIAALQLLESLTSTRIIVVTTSMLNGNSLIESLL